MGRPKKVDAGGVSTREKIMSAAAQLFAEKSFDAVSIRDITRSLGLNEASLYNHFKGKQDLLDAILSRLDERLITPGFAPLPPEVFRSPEAGDLADFLITGGRRFFAKADGETLLAWRILMAGQYRYPAARDMVRCRLLDGPVPFFRQIVEGFLAAGKLDPSTDCQAAAQVIGALFFDFSFRSNLEAAWNSPTEEAFRSLEKNLRIFCSGIKAD